MSRERRSRCTRSLPSRIWMMKRRPVSSRSSEYALAITASGEVFSSVRFSTLWVPFASAPAGTPYALQTWRAISCACQPLGRLPPIADPLLLRALPFLKLKSSLLIASQAISSTSWRSTVPPLSLMSLIRSRQSPCQLWPPRGFHLTRISWPCWIGSGPSSWGLTRLTFASCTGPLSSQESAVTTRFRLRRRVRPDFSRRIRMTAKS